MKKFSFVLVLAIVLLFAAHLLLFENQRTNNGAKKYKTPSEIKTENIAKKLEKRAAGWAKPDRPDEFYAFYNNIRTAAGATQPAYAPNYKLTELKAAQDRKLLLKSVTEELNWIERGPANVSGRTRGLIIDPDDKTAKTWFVGSVGGGIWKTTNSGGSWINLSPDLPSLSTVCLAMAKSNTQIIYAGTGEGFGNLDGIIGDGIFKSTDKGITWKQLATTANNADFHYVNKIIIDPEDENLILAATNTILFRSTDGGESWQPVFSVNRKIQQIIANPNDFNILYAAINGMGVIKSDDKGLTWHSVFENSAGRIELAIAPSNSEIVYALNQNSKLFISENGGQNWSPTSITSGNTDLYLSSQGWYDNTLATMPTDPFTLLIGGVNLYKVKINGTSKIPVSYIKADTTGTASFMSFVNFGGAYLGGGIDIDASNNNYLTLEVQFGPGKSQKAHRFTVPNGATSEVPSSSYTYQDYVDVPFEVWDPNSNRQLMVSFRDQDQNGVFNLTAFDDNQSMGREYFWINNVDYALSPASNIARAGGHEYSEIVFAWPVLRDGGNWDPDNLPDSKITISRSLVYSKEVNSKKIADWSGSGAPYVHADLHNIQIVANNGATRIVVANDGG